MGRHPILLAALVCCAGTVAAQPSVLEAQGEEYAEPKPPLTKLVVHPAKATVPALKYSLMPLARDLKQGNAALLYQRAQAGEWWNSLHRQNLVVKTIGLVEVPIEKMPRADVDFLTGFAALKEVDRAARRTYCDWEMLDRVRDDGLFLQMPDINSFRTYGNFLAVRSRYEMLDGKFDRAVFTFQTGFALGKHVGETPTLITRLVGNSIGHATLDQVQEFIQRPGAPSLFWSLADMRRPYVDMNRGLDGERVAVDSYFSEIREALNDRQAPPASVPRLVNGIKRIGSWRGDMQHPLGIALSASKAYPAARQYFLELGWTAEQLDRLPVLQVAVMHDLAVFDEDFDDVAKWANVPFHQAWPGLVKTNREREQRFHTGQHTLYLGALRPGLGGVLLARTRMDRRLDALQIVEAIRLYAGEHDGKLPESLEDIKGLPLPVDPVTGKAFDYKLQDGKAILTAPGIGPEVAVDRIAFRYEITIATTIEKK